MSEDRPPQPQPAKPQPPTATNATALQQVTKSLGQTWNRVKPVLKDRSIKTLRSTIHLLEGVVEKLEAEAVTPVGELPPSVVSTSETTVVVEVLSASSPPGAVTVVAPSLLEKLRRFLPTVTWWPAALQKIRSLLPESANQKLSDLGLSGAIAGILIILIWTTTALLPGKPTVVAKVSPEVTQVPAEVANVPPEVTQVPPVVPQAPPSGIPTPSELTAPQLPEPIKIAPPPPPILTPEQNLIASIQNQVAGITSEYANGLIQSIQVNFPSSQLIVRVGNGWYDLNSAQQDKLATEMLNRAVELDFSHLEITDSQDKLLARSPVVGKSMVILQRRILTESASG